MCCFRGGALKIEGGLRRLPHSPHPISTTRDGYISDRTVRRCFQKFHSVDQSLEEIVEQNSQQSAKEMFEIPFKYPVNEAVAVLLQC